MDQAPKRKTVRATYIGTLTHGSLDILKEKYRLTLLRCAGDKECSPEEMGLAFSEAGAALSLSRQYERALPFFRDAIRLIPLTNKPFSIVARDNLIVCMTELGSADEAKPLAQETLEMCVNYLEENRDATLSENEGLFRDYVVFTAHELARMLGHTEIENRYQPGVPWEEQPHPSHP